MTAISGGAGADTIRVLSTNQVDRAALDSALGLVSETTAPQGVLGTTNEVQHLSISTATGGKGHFTVKFPYSVANHFAETKALPLNVSAGDLQAAMRAAFLTLIGDPANLTVTPAAGGFDITFDKALGDVPQLVPQIMPLFIDGGAGGDRLRIQ